MGTALIDNTLGSTPRRTRRDRRVDILDTPLTNDRRSHARSSVLIETAGRSNEFGPAPDVVQWSRITRNPNGDDVVATLVVRALDFEKIKTAGTIGEEHYVHLLQELHPDRRVRIVVKRSGDDDVVLFQGYPMVSTLSWSPEHQSMTIDCLFEAQEWLRTSPKSHITGRVMRSRPHLEWVPSTPDLRVVESEPVVFNRDGKPNRNSKKLKSITTKKNEHELYSFDSDDARGAQLWNVADALRYVVYHTIDQADVAISVEEFLDDTKAFVGLGPASGSSDPFTRKMTTVMERVSIRSMNAEQALRVITQSVGLDFEIALRRIAGATSSDPEYFLRVIAHIEQETEETGSRESLMGAPVVYDIPREAPFTDPTGRTPSDFQTANAAQHSSLSIDRRVINRPAFMGGPIDYEVTLLLRPGWTPHANVDNMNPGIAKSTYSYWQNQLGYDPPSEWLDDIPNSIYHAKHPSFQTVSGVWRLWIFPDTAQYMAGYARSVGPYKQRMYDPFITEVNPDLSVYASSTLGGGIPQVVGKKMALRARPFRNLIARHNESGTDQSPIVRFNFKSTDADVALSETLNWAEFRGQVKFDEQRGAIWLNVNNILQDSSMTPDPNDSYPIMDMIQAYLGLDQNLDYVGPHFFVSITCTVRDDDRMSYLPRIPRLTQFRQRTELIDLESHFVRRERRGQNSHLNAQPIDSDALYEDRDDTTKFKKYCDEQATLMSYDYIAGPIHIPYTTTKYNLGDSFSGVHGLGIVFKRFPRIVAIVYSNDPDAGLQTKLILTDLRHNPEVVT